MLGHLSIRPINEAHMAEAHAFQCEYLDNETLSQFKARLEANPQLYIAAFDLDQPTTEQLVGICYGQPSPRRRGVLQLQGIAVQLDASKAYARKGIGSALLQHFEQCASQQHYNLIDLGCADDVGVEYFYMKNGYHPVELVAKNINGEDIERVAVHGYAQGKVLKEKLRQKHEAFEVIIIFEKSINAI